MTRAVSFFIIVFGAFWSMNSYSSVMQAQTLQDLPWLSVLIAGGVAIWGGLVVSLNRLDDDVPRATFIRWLAKDLVGAIVAGWFVFFLAGWAEWNIWLQATALLAAGYGGSKILDAASKRLVKVIDGPKVDP